MDPMKRLSAFLYGFVPSSALVCSGEGDPPGDGGGQAPQQPPPAPAQPASPPQFTPDQLAWIEGEKTRASNAAAAAARRAEQSRHGNRGEPQQQPQPSNQAQQPQGNAADPAQVYMRLRTFDRAADKYGLSDAARAILEGDFNTANPQDPVGWVTQRAEAFGWKAAGPATPATPAPETPAAKTAPQGAPVTSSGAPANPTTVTDDTPILRMTEGDRIALRRRIGDAAYVERMRKEFREGNVRVRFGR